MTDAFILIWTIGLVSWWLIIRYGKDSLPDDWDDDDDDGGDDDGPVSPPPPDGKKLDTVKEKDEILVS